jgi:hypothetical protein
LDQAAQDAFDPGDEGPPEVQPHLLDGLASVHALVNAAHEAGVFGEELQEGEVGLGQGRKRFALPRATRFGVDAVEQVRHHLGEGVLLVTKVQVKGTVSAIGGIGDGADRGRLVPLALEHLTGGREQLLGGSRRPLLTLGQRLVHSTPSLH